MIVFATIVSLFHSKNFSLYNRIQVLYTYLLTSTKNKNFFFNLLLKYLHEYSSHWIFNWKYAKNLFEVNFLWKSIITLYKIHNFWYYNIWYFKRNLWLREFNLVVYSHISALMLLQASLLSGRNFATQRLPHFLIYAATPWLPPRKRLHCPGESWVGLPHTALQNG